VILPRVNEAEGNLKKRREGPYGGVGVLPYRGEEGVCFFFFFPSYTKRSLILLMYNVAFLLINKYLNKSFIGIYMIVTIP
jgi:hypothetical protein